MKIIVILVSLFWANSVVANPELPKLSCKSEKMIEGWGGYQTHDYVHYSALVASDTEILKAEITGAWESDRRDLKADEDPENKYHNRRFRVLEDAWCWFNLLVPKGFSKFKRPFKGKIQFACEEWHGYEYVPMTCSVQR